MIGFPMKHNAIHSYPDDVSKKQMLQILRKELRKWCFAIRLNALRRAVTVSGALD